jgi:hypothetical protein
MLQSKHEYFRYAKRAGVTALALVLGVLVFGGYAASLPKLGGGALPAVPNKDKDKDKQFTQVYQHSYDEVFQASQETIERMGMFVGAKDKDKGTISGNGNYLVPMTGGGGGGRYNATFDILIETLNTKPETRVTIHAKVKDWMVGGIVEKGFKLRFLGDLQQVLSTYH